MKIPQKKYAVIYADPPWTFSSRLRSTKKVDGKYQQYHPDTTVGAKYNTMSIEEIKTLPIADIKADKCVLFLWTTDAHIPDALDVIKAWGFTYRTVAFVWNKKEVSGKQVCYCGPWTMKGTELCLLGATPGATKLIKSHKVRQLVEATRNRKKHSAKPVEVRKRIEELFGSVPRIELFAREATPGWDSWGDEL
jgi:site-specific DNA-methyltransferase (adenine-specific)